MHCQAPEDSPSSFLAVQRYELSVADLEEVSMGHERSDHCTHVPLSLKVLVDAGERSPHVLSWLCGLRVGAPIGTNVVHNLRLAIKC